ncbi:right-handed parallel beta-helix repeat-containing protein [Vallitalea pronyensis]|uniref:Right-handed parallel beta-helix repeat-containing protein n=1 Tax=Vallitalea pronyensis TaxID=1348613 RepID=A0A8J8SGA7_9FIRM|nr:DNRLRE domain-containing protein [Vallitalea pronyensis]QUI22108.1 right-handed parallel beta-helix repeat-containing protein [Vallitalea pronyensis]
MKRIIKKGQGKFLSLLMGTVLIFSLYGAVIPVVSHAAGSTYYVDSASGNDSNSGTSTSAPWKTLQKVNSMNFNPGDRILFKAGGIWTGQLTLDDSGTSMNPIVIDQYGSGDKPLINGNGLVGEGVVYLYNTEYIELNNLEITNNAASEGDRRGVYVEAANAGLLHHVHLKNLTIHHVKGMTGSTKEAKRTAGISIRVTADNLVDTRYDGVLIEGCHIYTVDNQGIVTETVDIHNDDPSALNYPGQVNFERRKFTNLVIRNNIIHDIGKNCIILRNDENGLVEYNVVSDNAVRSLTGNSIFTRTCTGTVMQYNEGYDNGSSNYDGCMYDADLESPNTIWQYSYSHNNHHGLFWACTAVNDSGIKVRYNISQNDKGGIFVVNYPNNGIDIYNNTVYIGAHRSPTILYERHKGGNGPRKYSFMNNIIYNESSSATYDFYTANNDYNRTIDYNLYYGNHPSNEPNDTHKLTVDPLFVNPGSATYGIDSCDGYQLTSSSPAINSGISIADNGGKDYWGNVLYKGAPDRGAHEYPSDSTPPSEESFIADEDAYVRGGQYATQNYGADAEIQIKQSPSNDSYSRKAYFKFDLNGKGLSTITSAKLKVYVNSTSGTYAPTTYEVHDDSWAESSITWNNAPALGGSITAATVSSAGQYVVWDITSYVNNQLSGDSIVTIGINDPAATLVYGKYNSKEATANKPTLVITH